MNYKYLSSSGAEASGRALEYFRRAGKETDSTLARAVAQAREFIFEAIRILYVPSSKGPAPPAIGPEGLVDAQSRRFGPSALYRERSRMPLVWKVRFRGFAMRAMVI